MFVLFVIGNLRRRSASGSDAFQRRMASPLRLSNSCGAEAPWTATIERGDNELEAKESEGRIIFGTLSAAYESPINPIRNGRSHKMGLICDS